MGLESATKLASLTESLTASLVVSLAATLLASLADSLAAQSLKRGPSSTEFLFDKLATQQKSLCKTLREALKTALFLSASSSCWPMICADQRGS
jgi:hypothetical protein